MDFLSFILLTTKIYGNTLPYRFVTIGQPHFKNMVMLTTVLHKTQTGTQKP